MTLVMFWNFRRVSRATFFLVAFAFKLCVSFSISLALYAFFKLYSAGFNLSKLNDYMLATAKTYSHRGGGEL